MDSDNVSNKSPKFGKLIKKNEEERKQQQQQKNR